MFTIKAYEGFLELPVVVVVAAMWLVGAVLLASWILALRYAWVLLS